jgi:VanZ family protein
MPGDNVPNTYLNDKVIHIIMFLGWAFCWQFAFKNYQKTLISGITYGLLLEIVQGYVLIAFQRSFEWHDILADSIGVIIGLLLFFVVTFLGLKK